MKKLKFLPSILMLVVCVAVLVVGVFAVSPTQNTISGSITINASNAEVGIELYVEEECIASYPSVRAGATLNFGNLAFNMEGVNEVYEVEDLDVVVKITNKSEKALGVYYSLAGNDDFAEAGDILTKDIINGTEDYSSTTLATAYFQSYSYIAPATDENGYNIVEMPIVFRCNTLSTKDITSEDFNYYLNIEEYTTTVTNDQVVNGSTSLSGLVKLPTTMTELTTGAFRGNTTATHIVVPSTITGLGYASLAAMISATNISIPESVTLLGENVFRQSSFVSIFLPKNIEYGKYSIFFGQKI